MFFKNITPYRVDMGEIDGNGLALRLHKHRLTPCGPLDRAHFGFVPPAPHNEDALVHTVNGCHLIALCVEEKLMPASVVKQAALEKSQEIERQQGHKVGRKQMREISEQVADEMLPKAFKRQRITRALIDPKAGLMFVDAGASTKADEFVSMLWKAADDINVSFLRTKMSAVGAMTGWLINGAPDGFTVDGDADLLSIGEESKVRHVNRNLEGEDITWQLEEGMSVNLLRMTFNDRISFNLDDAVRIKRIKFLDITQEGRDEATDAAELFDIDMTIMTGESSTLLGALVNALGGIQAGEDHGA